MIIKQLQVVIKQVSLKHFLKQVGTMSLITKEDVEIVICKSINSEAKVINYRLEPFTKIKTGILGSHTLLTVDIKDASRKGGIVSTCTYFMKTPPESSLVQDVFMDEGTFEEEVNFYNNIQPLMLADYNGAKWSVKCYLAKNNLLIYENLRVQGFSASSKLLMDKTSIKSALSTLARFHACSLLAERKLGKSFKQAYPKYFAEKMYADHNKYGRGTKVGYETIVLMAKKFGLDASMVLPHLLNYVRSSVKPKEGKINVVCHSDLWKNNIMFNDKLECIFVDYQILRYASPTVDVAMLVYLNTTPEFRKCSEIEVFKHYYLVFQEVLEQSGRKIEIPSYDYMLRDYLDHKLVGMTYAALYLPGIYSNPDKFSKLLNDPEALERFYLYNRIEYISPEIDSNPVYAGQIKDILIELLNETREVLRP